MNNCLMLCGIAAATTRASWWAVHMSPSCRAGVKNNHGGRALFTSFNTFFSWARVNNDGGKWPIAILDTPTPRLSIQLASYSKVNPTFLNVLCIFPAVSHISSATLVIFSNCCSAFLSSLSKVLHMFLMSANAFVFACTPPIVSFISDLWSSITSLSQSSLSPSSPLILAPDVYLFFQPPPL